MQLCIYSIKFINIGGFLMKNKPASITYEISCLHPEVTGSAIILTFHFPNKTTKQVLIDCGMYQEFNFDKYNFDFPTQFHPENIDYVFLTHTHMDHCGRLPFLIKKGYYKNIYCTNLAKRFLKPALFDSAQILDYDSKHLSKKFKTFVEPLYEIEDVKRTLNRGRGLNYNDTFKLDDNLDVTLLGNGHLMGAAMILIQVSYPCCETINLLFTGDYNVDNLFQDIPGIPKWVKKLKLIIFQESTYGDCTTESINYTYDDTLISLTKENKTVISPVIACERAEQVLLRLKNLQDKELLSKSIPIYLAGSLAIEYFKIFIEESKVDFIPENLKLVSTSNHLSLVSEMIGTKGICVIDEIPEDVLQSSTPKIILTTSGMADKGKAPYYLSKLVHREDVAIIFTCYLPSSTLGYTLKNAKKGEDHTFNVYGEKVRTQINCDIFCSNEFSSHAKADQLLDFLKQFPNLVGVFVNHGELKTKEIYSEMIENTINPSFVQIMDRSICYSMTNFKISKILNSKYSTLEDIEQKKRKIRKERKLLSKKSKPKYKNNNKRTRKYNLQYT